MPTTTDHPKLGPRFDDALVHAARLHRTQVRKGTDIPYVSHLMTVAALVLEHGGTEEEAIAALLHDAVEDQGGMPTLNDIDVRFGPAVAAIVRDLSDSLDDTRTGAGDKANWRKRKEAYLAHLGTASPSVRMISAADKLHNCRSLVSDLEREGEAVWARFNAGKEDQLWFYRAFHAALKAGGPTPLVDAFDDALLDLERVAMRSGVAKAATQSETKPG